MTAALRSEVSVTAHPHLSSLEARCMKAYYALRQDAPPEEIGAPDIRHWLRVVDGIERAPADATVLKALEKTGGSLTQAAELLGISFRSIRYKVKKLGLRS